MKPKAIHEPDANIMSAIEVWDDAQQIAQILKQNMLKSEPMVQIGIPFSFFLSALDTLTRDDLLMLHKRIEERLAV
jgi:hypothetical protein